MAYSITGLFSYPVKSLSAISLESGIIDDFGFEGDRRFMFVNRNGRFITQRSHPVLGQIHAHFDGAILRLSYETIGSLDLSLDLFNRGQSVEVWGNHVDALGVSDERVQFVSELIGEELSLVYMPESSFRQVDRDFFAEDQRVGFADGFPFLLTNEASLSDLNGRLESPVGMGRFRPNIVVKGNQAFEEDSWKRIAIGNVEFAVVKPCSRCVMTTIDENGRKTGKEPLKTLSGYRKNEFGACFGQNLVQLSKGTIKVEDELRVLEEL